MRTAAAALLLLAGIARGGDDPVARADREELIRLYDAIAKADDPRWLRDAKVLRRAYEQGEFVEGVRDRVEVHGVALQRGTRTDAERAVRKPSRATVRVTRKGCGVYLVLCGYDAIDWRVEVDAGVDLRKVFVYGVRKQRVRGVAPGKVIHRDRVFVLNHCDREYARFSSMVARQLSARTIHTYDGRVDLEEGVLIVGPTSAVWRRQMLLTSMRDLEKRALKERRARELRAMSGTVFPMIAWTGGRARKMCDASASAIVQDSLQPIPRAAFALAVDPETGHRFILDHVQIHEQDADGKFLRAIGPPSWIPHGYVMADIAFDPRRRRLVVALLTGRFAEYSLETREWQQLGDTPTAGPLRLRGWGRGGMLTAMTWDAGRDCFWALYSSGRSLSLRRYSAEGTPVGKPAPFRLPIQIQGGPRNGTVIRMSGSRLVVFPAEVTRNNRTRPRTNSRSFVFDPTSAQLVGEHKLKELLSIPTPPREDLAGLWEELNSTDCYSAIQRLARGDDSTVAFLRAEWDKQPRLDDEDLRELLRDLGSTHAARRWDAMRRLAQAGSVMRTTLANAIDAADSPHVRMALLLQLETIDDGPDLPRRLDRVLTGIDTEKAREFRALVRAQIADD